MPIRQSLTALRTLRRLAVGLLLTATLAAGAAADPPEEFVVTGRYPGPPLWKVNRGVNELWIFGTLNTIPQDMTWGSLAAERVIDRAEEVLLQPGVNAWTYNPFRYLGLYRRVRKLRRNEGDGVLAEVLPPELYERYAVLRDRYSTGRDVERRRPAVAAARLYAAALDAAGLTSGRDLQKTVERIAKSAHVQTIETEIHVDPAVLLEQAAELSPAAEIDCFATIMASIESDLPGLAARAQAWAVGDVAALRRFDYPDVEGDCSSFVGSAEGLRVTLETADAAWLDAAERALAANRTTFATLGMKELLRPDGLLAELRERGYEVLEP
jgi:uncharacterized protein YbaP (TraB family)